MSHATSHNIITFCWGTFFVVWLFAAFFTKRTVQSETAAERFRYVIPMLIAWFFLFRGQRLGSPLNTQIIPQTDAILILSSFLCLCGLAFCLWARAVIGRHWSGP